jgi:hypothetical protein
MKKLLVLSGNHVRNREWGEQCAEFFRGDFDMTFYPHYDHWNVEGESIDMEIELQKVKETVTGAGEADGWYVFAKSIGSVLALLAIKRGIISLEKCVFFGMPLKIAETEVTKEWAYLSSLTLPVLAFHNDHDPVADYKFTAQKLAELAPTITLRTLSGDTHDYADFAAYADEIRQFISS